MNLKNKSTTTAFIGDRFLKGLVSSRKQKERIQVINLEIVLTLTFESSNEGIEMELDPSHCCFRVSAVYTYI